jgi:hypothetical protein
MELGQAHQVDIAEGAASVSIFPRSGLRHLQKHRHRGVGTSLRREAIVVRFVLTWTDVQGRHRLDVGKECRFAITGQLQKTLPGYRPNTLVAF